MKLASVTKSTPFRIDSTIHSNPLSSLALGSDASVCRSLCRYSTAKHMMKIGSRSRARITSGTSFVEIYQNCNVFNDGQFSDVIKRNVRDEMMIDLVHGEPILFGADASAA